MRRFLVALLIASIGFGAEIVMRVDGLACAFCAYGLEKKLKKLEGVESVDISLNKGLVRIKLREGYTLEEETLKKIVKESGFVLRGIEVKGP